jgi:hypothetical protein
MKYEKIENKWIRKSTKKNSKWNLEFTTAKKIEENQIENILVAFNNVPPNYEKYTEEYKGIRNKGIKYTVINDTKLIKREIILIPLEDN